MYRGSDYDKTACPEINQNRLLMGNMWKYGIAWITY